MEIPEIVFKRGTYPLNDQPNYDFQLNRVIQWDGGSLADVQKIGSLIHNSADWKRELIALGDCALAENRTENAIAYYRMSEFFMYDGDPDKRRYYELATNLFYEYYHEFFDSGLVGRASASYEGAQLPIMHVKPKGKRTDTILLHGGNDSYFEELFFPMLYLARLGFEVFLYEGPGQGGVVRIQGKKFTHEWEKPTSAVLDTIAKTDVTIMGASLGGMLAPRAAAFDSRIKRVVGWSVFPNFLDVALHGQIPPKLWGVLRFMLRNNMRGAVNGILKQKMNKSETVDWAVRHGMYAYDATDPFGYVKKLDDYKMTDIGPRLTQDMLIIGAQQDHFIPPELYSQEIDALPHVKSLTFRLMTEREDAGSHCNVGNPKLVLDTVADWILGLQRRDKDNHVSD